MVMAKSPDPMCTAAWRESLNCVNGTDPAPLQPGVANQLFVVAQKGAIQ